MRAVVKKIIGIVKITFFSVSTLALIMHGFDTKVSAYSGLGTGTIGDPYRITTCLQLQEIQNDLSAHYVLTNDIDCSSTSTWNSGLGFIPIAISSNFTGSLNGSDYTISSLYINRTDASDTALFGNASGATIENIHLRGGSVTNNNSTPYVGSILSDGTNVTIRNCSSNMPVSSLDGGGLIGYMNGGSVESCWYAGASVLTGNRYTGGIFGLVINTNITNVYSTGSIEARGAIAGVLGTGNTLSNVYSDADLTYNDNSDVGGLFGSVDGLSTATTATDSFFAGTINAASASNVGAIVGSLETGATITNMYYDTFACGCGSGVGATSGGSGTPTAVNAANATPQYFKGNNTNPPLSAWDFVSRWNVVTGDYPLLQITPQTNSKIEDYNNDGIIDSAQYNLSGYTSSITGKKVLIDVGENCEITTDDIAQESLLEASDPAYEYAHGLFDFAADCPSPGYTTTIKLYYFNVEKQNYVARKYNPNTKAYFTLGSEYGASVTQIDINGSPTTVITYQITDGGVLDMDGTVNAEISDPAGLATAVLGAPNTGFGKLAR